MCSISLKYGTPISLIALLESFNMVSVYRQDGKVEQSVIEFYFIDS